MIFLKCWLFLLFLLPIGSGLIMPMTKQNGDPDMISIISHVTLMEQTMSSLQTQVQITTDELTTVKGKLQTVTNDLAAARSDLKTTNNELTTVNDKLKFTEDELKASNNEVTALKSELKLAETDIAILKHDMQKSAGPSEFANLKSDFEALKASQKSLLQQLNFTVIDVVSVDVKLNTGEINFLKSELLATKKVVSETATDLQKTNGTLTRAVHDVLANSGEISLLKSQSVAMTKSLNTTSTRVQTLEAQFPVLEGHWNTVQIRENITEQELAETKALLQATTVLVETIQDQVNISGNVCSLLQECPVIKQIEGVYSTPVAFSHGSMFTKKSTAATTTTTTTATTSHETTSGRICTDSPIVNCTQLDITTHICSPVTPATSLYCPGHCSVRVVPQGEELSKKSESCLSSRHANQRRPSMKVNWPGEGIAFDEGNLLDVHIDACLLQLGKVAREMGLDSEFYRHPIVVVTITVSHIDKSQQCVIHEPYMDWGRLIVTKQVPSTLPDPIGPGTVVLHVLLAKCSPVVVDIKFGGTINGNKVMYWATVEKDVPYLADPNVLANTLQVLENQLHRETKGTQAPRGKLLDKSGNSRDTKRNFSIDTGYNTSSISLGLAARNMDDSIITDAVSENEKEAHDHHVTLKRKNTPINPNASNPRKLSSLKHRIEAMAFREEDEETEDERVFTRRMSRRISRLSRFGRMSRMSRRYSRCSIGGDSNSSIIVNPPGNVRSIHSRMLRSRRESRSESCSATEFRLRPGEISDIDTSATESDRDRLASISNRSIGAYWSESSCGLCGSQVSFDLSTADTHIMSYMNKTDTSQSETSLRGQSGDEKVLKPSSKDASHGCASDVCRCVQIPGSNCRAMSARSITGKQVKRQRRPTPMAMELPKRQDLRLISSNNAAIAEEQDPGEETETDGYMSDNWVGRRLSDTSRHSLRRKRFSKRRVTNLDVARMSRYGNFALTTSPIPGLGDHGVLLPLKEDRNEGRGQEVQGKGQGVVTEAGEQSHSPSETMTLGTLSSNSDIRSADTFEVSEVHRGKARKETVKSHNVDHKALQDDEISKSGLTVQRLKRAGTTSENKLRQRSTQQGLVPVN